jgi:hypothetical protein
VCAARAELCTAGAAKGVMCMNDTECVVQLWASMCDDMLPRLRGVTKQEHVHIELTAWSRFAAPRLAAFAWEAGHQTCLRYKAHFGKFLSECPLEKQPSR